MAIISFIRTKGPRRFLQECLYRGVNGYYEWRFGVQTTRTVRLKELGITQQDALDSTPLGYGAFFTIVNALPLDPRASVFIDFGVGKGRAVCAAATLPFKRVIGVDISDVLIAKAEDNLRRHRHCRAGSVQLVQSDAAAFAIAPDVNLFYFYNPFVGDTLRRVVGNIRASFEQHPRKIHVVFFNNDHFDEVVGGETWIRKTRQTSYYPGISCGVYETV